MGLRGTVVQAALVRGTAWWTLAVGGQPEASPTAEREDTSTGAASGSEEFVVNQEELKILY